MLDTPNLPVPEPTTTYIIASTMRTGSYLLCEGLETTGCAGHPEEVFCPERRSDYSGHWNLPDNTTFANFLRTAIRKGTTQNGVCGMKIHWHHVEPLALRYGGVGKPWRILKRLFPTAKYIHLRRRNRRAQAISWYRALVTNRWWQIEGIPNDATAREPEFNAAEIRRLEIDLEQQQHAWDEYFSTQPVEVMTMDYEALAADYRGEVARVLSFLGQDPAVAQKIPDPRMQCQSDAMTKEWHRRMDAEFPLKTQED